MEQVLVVKTEILKPFLCGSFISENTEKIIETVRGNFEFIDRPSAEEDLAYKQIIPYIYIRRGEDILVLKRRKAQTEKRLHGLLSLGVGGHINPVDTDGDVLMNGLMRELNEEVRVPSVLSMEFKGIINDNSSEVSNYHLGLCYELITDGEAEVLETEKMEGSFVPAAELDGLKEQMETWSQVLLEADII